MKLASLIVAATLSALLGIAHAQSAVHKASGKVTKVDPAKGSVTIAHGPVASMNWPSMTMSFKAKDKAMLDKVKPGDEVQFSFVQSGRDHTITDIK